MHHLRIQYDAFQAKTERLLDLLIDGAITQAEHENRLSGIKSEQQKIEIELEELTTANHEYHVTAGKVLDLAQRAADLFEVSEVNEKRQLLKYLLQNSRVDGRNLVFDLRKPFDTIASIKGHSIGLRG